MTANCIIGPNEVLLRNFMMDSLPAPVYAIQAISALAGDGRKKWKLFFNSSIILLLDHYTVKSTKWIILNLINAAADKFLVPKFPNLNFIATVCNTVDILVIYLFLQ